MNLFADTNVLVYLVDRSDESKRLIARDLLDDDAHRLVVSAQVMGELFVTLQRKLASVISDDDIARHVRSFSPLCSVALDAQLVQRAIETSQRHLLSYWDSLIVESARQAGCDRLATEDLQHGSVIRGVEVWNPFADLA